MKTTKPALKTAQKFTDKRQERLAVYDYSQLNPLLATKRLLACCLVEQRVCACNCVGAIAPRCHPHSAWFEWIHAKVVEFWVEIWKGALEIEA